MRLGTQTFKQFTQQLLMITKDSHVTQSGDCIVAVAADKSVADLSAEFKDELRKPNAKLTIELEVDGLKEK